MVLRCKGDSGDISGAQGGSLTHHPFRRTAYSASLNIASRDKFSRIRPNVPDGLSSRP